MKAVEAVKVKFYCFLGIVNPTVYNTVGEPDYNQLGQAAVPRSLPPLQVWGRCCKQTDRLPL